MTDIAALTARIDKLEHELDSARHSSNPPYPVHLRILHRQDAVQQVVDLFADDGDVWFLGGIYKGKRACGASHQTPDQVPGHNGPRYGWLLNIPSCKWSTLRRIERPPACAAGP